MIDATFISITDQKLAEQDVPLHARPFHVMMAWRQSERMSGDILDPQFWTPLMGIYKELYPSGDFSMPSMFVGGVGLRDKMYFAKVHLSYGNVAIDPLKCIDISRAELNVIWMQHPDQVWRAIYSVADLWDFIYGVDDLQNRIPDADQLWLNARSAIASTARTLMGTMDLGSAVQSASLSAELAMKGTLAFLGWSESKRRKLGHNLVNLADAIISERPTICDDSLRRACATFPDYVDTRYKAHGLTRVQLMTLGMRAQFIAAEALRRLSMRNLGATIDAGQASPPREEL